MLGVIKKAVSEFARDTRNHQNHISNQIRDLMYVTETYPISAVKLMEKLGLKSRVTF